MGRREEALAHFKLCAELTPNDVADNATTFNNIGNVLQSLGRSEEALQWLDRALDLRPDFVEALSNKAIALGQLRRFDEALAIYDGVKALDPDHAVSDWNAALLHMLTGNFEAGWAGREARWKIASAVGGRYPKFTEPMWLGRESIEGKTILIPADEGLGDAIQFARYVPMVAARARASFWSFRMRCVRCCPDCRGSRSAFRNRWRPMACRRSMSIARLAACRWPSEPGSIQFRPTCRICRHLRRPV